MKLHRRAFLAGSAGLAAGLAGCGAPGGAREESSVTPAPVQASNGTSAASPDSTASSTLSVSWSTGPDMARRRTQTTAVGLDGELYVIGGITDADAERTVAVFDPSSERWRDAAPPPEPVNHTSAVALRGRIHVLGGYTGSFLGSDPLDAHWIYDPDDAEWTDAPALPTPRGALVAVTIGERIYAAGGATDRGTTDRLEVYDASAGTWHDGPAMPTPREHLAAGAIDGGLYVAGGRRGLSPMVDATERYDPGREAWERRSAMPKARAGIAGAVLDGRLFVFGGEQVSERVFGDVDAYHPGTDAWASVSPLPTPRWGLGAAAIDDRIYTVGGGAVPSAEHTARLEIMSVA